MLTGSKQSISHCDAGVMPCLLAIRACPDGKYDWQPALRNKHPLRVPFGLDPMDAGIPSADVVERRCRGKFSSPPRRAGWDRAPRGHALYCWLPIVASTLASRVAAKEVHSHFEMPKNVSEQVNQHLKYFSSVGRFLECIGFSVQTRIESTCNCPDPKAPPVS